MTRMEVMIKVQAETQKLNLEKQHHEMVRDVTCILAMLVDSPLELYEICMTVLAKTVTIDSAEKDLHEYVKGVRNDLERKRAESAKNQHSQDQQD